MAHDCPKKNQQRNNTWTPRLGNKNSNWHSRNQAPKDMKARVQELLKDASAEELDKMVYTLQEENKQSFQEAE